MKTVHYMNTSLSYAGRKSQMMSTKIIKWLQSLTKKIKKWVTLGFKVWLLLRVISIDFTNQFIGKSVKYMLLC